MNLRISDGEANKEHAATHNTNWEIEEKLEHAENLSQQQNTSGWKCILRQGMIAFGMNFHSLSVGVALAFPTIAIAHLHGLNNVWTIKGEKFKIHVDSNSSESKISYDDEQASWHGGLAMTSVLLGSLVASAVQPRFGRRTVLAAADIFLTIAWSLSSVAEQPTLILASSAIASFYAGSLVSPLLVYQSETLSPKSLRKPFLLPATHISLMIGTVIEMALGSHLDRCTVAAVNTIFPGICLLILLTLPASHAIHKQYIKNTTSTSFKDNMKEQNTWLNDLGQQSEKSNTNNLEKTFQDPHSGQRKTPRLRVIVLLIASLCFHHLCGMTIVQTYSISILEMLSIYGIPHYISSFPLMLSCIQIGGASVGLALRGWTGRSCRTPLLLASFVGSIGSSLALGLYSHFFVHRAPMPNPNVSILSAIPIWLPSVLLGIFSFSSCMSIPLVPYTFAGQFFPSFAVGFPSRLALLLSCICCFLSNKFFFTMVKLVGLRGFFWIYSATGSMCAALICILLPLDMDPNCTILKKSPWHEMDEDLVEAWAENLSDSSSEEIGQGLSSVIGVGDEKCKVSETKSEESTSQLKIERRSSAMEVPDWLGDISWAGRNGGWLIEETKRGGWRVVERGKRHESGGGKSMDVEKGTWIGHMIEVVTNAATSEESKDIAKWKLANRARKRWVITRGPNNQWQICSEPWEGDTSDESDDENESDDTDTSDENKTSIESSCSEDLYISENKDKYMNA